MAKLEIVSEDTVRCFLFPTSSTTDVLLDELCNSVNETVNNLSNCYIWHRDEFKVHVPITNENYGKMPHLVSMTCYGDNIEDEWFIVYLLLEITKKFPHLVVKVQDNDGDFLLIEAAEHLPSWANPDSTENRTFIYQNGIHIIPPSLADLDTELSTPDAINIIVNQPKETKSPDIEQAILKRIGKYPEKFQEHIHRAIVSLPLDIATLLMLEPSYISPIVSSYCNHDMIDAKICKTVTFKDCTTVQVKFTKCLYAMLTHSKLIRNLKQVSINVNDKKSVLGLKITCGYEMIMSCLKGDVFSTQQYSKFLKSLTKNGYFKDNIEDSKEYTRLLDKAKDFYLDFKCSINSHLSSKISQLMESEEFLKMKDSLKDKVTDIDLVEDSDDWLNINPEELNNLLNTRYGKATNLKNHDVITSETITSEIKNFLKGTSDFEGIETSQNKEQTEIEFDPELFVDSLKNMLNIINGDETVDSNSDTDYDFEEEPEEDLDKEIRSKLFSDIHHNTQDSKSIVSNMIQSMKEEQGAPGPTSNILRTIGINKIDIPDSDDDSS